MMHKTRQTLPLALDVTKLKKCAPEPLQQQFVTGLLLALGSNHHAEYYLPRAREKLRALGKIQVSTAFQNLDFTATLESPKPDYTNQCVYLNLSSAMTLQQLQQAFKSFEGDCDRQRKIEAVTLRQITIRQVAVWQVTMDIDILLIRLHDSEKWVVMADRYPFKAHESAGVVELADGSGINF